MILRKTILPVILMVVFYLPQYHNAQQKVFKGNPDTAFKIARDLAFSGQHKQAQDSLKLILTKYPNYLDVRAFLASAFSWSGNYKKARKEFAYVLNKDKKRKTVWVASIKNEQYDKNFFKAYELSKKALQVFPNDVNLLQLKAKSEFNSGKKQEALITIEEALKLDSNNTEVLNYKKTLENLLRFNTLNYRYSMDVYAKNERDNMYYSTLSYSRQTKFGSINTNMNYAYRFQKNNYQLEIDLYPKISKGMYAYLSGGFSNSALFPSVRFGAEVFKLLPKNLEASFGFRWLKLASPITIYTGSFSWYKGNSYWSYRTYVTPGDLDVSVSRSVIYKGYRSDADNFFSVEIGLGTSPALDRFIPGFTGSQIFQLDSQKLVLRYSFSTKNKKNVWGFNAGTFREEKPFAKGDYFLYASFGVTYLVKF